MLWMLDAIAGLLFIALYVYVFEPEPRRIMLGKYGKTITAIITGAIGWATLVVNSDAVDITANEWIVGATALATALGVYAVANAPQSTP